MSGRAAVDDRDVAVVTGASRGIGRATAEALLACGATVFATATKRAHLEDLANTHDEPGALIPVELDVRDSRGAGALANFLGEQVHAVTLLVNNAGRMNGGETLDSHTVDAWHEVVGVNLTGPFLVTRALLGALKAADVACVVNVGGGMGAFSSGMKGGGFAAYRASKAGLNALTLSLANEFAAHDIRVCSYDPGWVRTDLGGHDADKTPRAAAGELISLVGRMRGDESLTGVLVSGSAVTAW